MNAPDEAIGSIMIVRSTGCCYAFHFADRSPPIYVRIIDDSIIVAIARHERYIARKEAKKKLRGGKLL